MAGLAQWEGDVKVRCESCNNHPWDSLDVCIDGTMYGECGYPGCGGACVRNAPCSCTCHDVTPSQPSTSTTAKGNNMKKQAGGALFGALLALIITVAPTGVALAHSVAVTASTVCNTDGTWTANFTAESVDAGAANWRTFSPDWVPNGTFVSTSTNFTLQVANIPNSTATITRSIDVQWSNQVGGNGSATATRPDPCTIPTTTQPTTTTTSPPATSTTAPPASSSTSSSVPPSSSEPPASSSPTTTVECTTGVTNDQGVCQPVGTGEDTVPPGTLPRSGVSKAAGITIAALICLVLGFGAIRFARRPV